MDLKTACDMRRALKATAAIIGGLLIALALHLLTWAAYAAGIPM